MVTTVLLVIAVVLMVAVVGFLVGVLIKSIRNEQRKSGARKIWANFGLSLVLATLFFTSWIAQGFSQWQEFVQTQRAHNEPAAFRDFVGEFSARTLENWQSEFLQLFSFVVLAALYIHRGSAESRDADDRMEEALHRIEQMLKEGKR
jgi:uncharacterized membrane protein YraQ (UPF0718 family)